MCWGYNSGVRSWVCSLDAHTRQKDEKLEHLIYEWSLNIWVTQNYLLNQAYTFCFSSHFNQVQTSKAPPLQSNSFSDSTNYTGPSLSLPAENNFWTPWTEQWSGTERCFHLEWAVFEKRREGGVRSFSGLWWISFSVGDSVKGFCSRNTQNELTSTQNKRFTWLIILQEKYNPLVI